MSELKAEFKEYRHVIVNAKRGVRGDRFLRLLLDLCFHAKDGRGRGKYKHAARSLEDFLAEPGLKALLDKGGAEAERILAEELADAAKSYTESCRIDPTYGRGFFQLVSLKPEQIAEKAGTDVYYYLIALLLETDSDKIRRYLIVGLDRAYRDSFGSLAYPPDIYLEEDKLKEFYSIIRPEA